MTRKAIADVIERIAREAKAASRLVARAPAETRERAIREVARLLGESQGTVLDANEKDLLAGKDAGLSEAMLDRLRLTPERIAGMQTALEEIAAMADPLGALEDERTRPNGLRVAKVRIPLGVIGFIYESRPNVTTDAFALCLRAGNAIILRGGKEAFHSNQALGALISAGLEAAGLPARAAQVVPVTDRAGVLELLKRTGEIDLIIPRGGEGLIQLVTENSRIPVIQHYKGVCHVYVDAACDAEMGLRICENAKVQRPSVCNACETILVHEAVADSFVPRLVERLAERGVEIRGDSRTQVLGGDKVRPATEDDWHTEYLALIVSVRVVPSVEAAIDHIQTYGSQHTEAIVTQDEATARKFLGDVQSSTVLWNASTRFADGGELGLGAEIGISTSKLHAFGPMGARELTTTKFVVIGEGQTRN